MRSEQDSIAGSIPAAESTPAAESIPIALGRDSRYRTGDVSSGGSVWAAVRPRPAASVKEMTTMKSHRWVRTQLLTLVVMTAGTAGLHPAAAADKAIDLDRLAANGAESLVSTDVVAPSPVKVKNKVTNKAVGQT